ncbi:putative AraC family transcriptional regulator [Flavihumibacter petaseus NBRC 106054]|uniref:Putative AraC family transcriptional regulator n=2 Tax=Flavihumibacter TaxID=1004301 RepID=A0A0E9N3P5_9BACT|nr:putative AraC family transcriptional regulator [Flavihumibacter petaseus NBRC 106054]
MAIYIGQRVQTKLHTHHAIEIAIAFDKPFLISRNGTEFKESVCTFINADLAHQFNGQDDHHIFIYFDAESAVAQLLETSLNLDVFGILDYTGISINGVKNLFIDWFYDDSANDKAASNLIQLLLESILGTSQRHNILEPRIADAIELVRSALYSEIRLEAIAAKVFLSEGRFAHLFKEQIGIPFRRYVLWCRLQAALKAIVQGRTLTQAAYEGGFADISHFSRTFTEMFGASPSVVLKQ